MKTQILQLEPHDDLVSALDKMGWGKSARIILVWPKKTRLLRRRLDLVLLQRRSHALGAQLCLVTNDPRVRYFAFQTGITVFSTLRKAQNKPWKKPGLFVPAQEWQAEQALQSTARPLRLNNKQFRPGLARSPASWLVIQSPVMRLAIFSAAIVSLLGMLVVLYPQAEIVIEPKIESQQIAWIVKPDPSIDTFTLTGDVPARQVSVIVEGRAAIPASGTILFPDKPASGTAIFTNLTEDKVTIEKGTIVRSLDDQRFEVTSTGVLPAGIGATASLPVSSLLAGKKGNIPAHALGSIEGSLGSQASVTNTLPLRNGSDRRLPAPTTGDKERLVSGLNTTLRASATSEIQKKLSADDLLLPDSLGKPEVISEIFIPADNGPANEISLSLRLEYTAWYLPAREIHLLANSALDANLPKDYSPVNNSLSISLSPETRIPDMHDASLAVTFQRKITRRIQVTTLIQKVLGKSVGSAQSVLLDLYPDLNKADIRMIPGWWRRLPLAPFRIQVSYVSNSSEASLDD